MYGRGRYEIPPFHETSHIMRYGRDYSQQKKKNRKERKGFNPRLWFQLVLLIESVTRKAFQHSAGLLSGQLHISLRAISAHCLPLALKPQTHHHEFHPQRPVSFFALIPLPPSPIYPCFIYNPLSPPVHSVSFTFPSMPISLAVVTGVRSVSASADLVFRNTWAWTVSRYRISSPQGRSLLL